VVAQNTKDQLVGENSAIVQRIDPALRLGRIPEPYGDSRKSDFYLFLAATACGWPQVIFEPTTPAAATTLANFNWGQLAMGNNNISYQVPVTELSLLRRLRRVLGVMANESRDNLPSGMIG
jgi:hypothetical protein